MNFSSEFQSIQNSVVNMLALDAQNNVLSSGSGTIIGSGNLVLTCAHCIVPNTSAVARHSNQNTGHIGNVIFIDKAVDVALIQFQTNIGKAAPLRASSSVLVGHEVFAVGFPNNISYITALSGNVAGFEPTPQFSYIRIDASVNHGNSGGPLFNSAGELVGVVNAKHGSLSAFLQTVQNAQPVMSMSIGGIDPVVVIQQLISEMQQNLNLGIGYAIPIDYIGTLNTLVNNLIKKI